MAFILFLSNENKFKIGFVDNCKEDLDNKSKTLTHETHSDDLFDFSSSDPQCL